MSKNIILKHKEGEIFTDLFPKTKTSLVYSNDNTKNLDDILKEINKEITTIHSSYESTISKINSLVNSLDKINLSIGDINLLKTVSKDLVSSINEIKNISEDQKTELIEYIDKKISEGGGSSPSSFIDGGVF